ncbi:C-C motif chemokine 21b-like [Eleutherodactylus coqui]|uniref:C-C motif chemokine 21b-like n=1 Tax=Eleutherodactylus coqui TaxID=57060 RepID=UPI0034631733
MKVMLSLALLVASAIFIISADMGGGNNCCTKVSSRKPNPAFEIKGFHIQNASLPCVDAVLFVTNTKIIICANPKTPWVKKKVEELRKKEAENKKTE